MTGLRVQIAGSRGGIVRRATAILALLLSSVTAQASSSSASFGVSVTLFPPFKDIAACAESSAGTNVTVTCTTAAPPRSDPPRFMLELYREGNRLGTVDGETAPGTVTSWKVYRVADRDFLEIVVGW
jgi:hypothetical protein